MTHKELLIQALALLDGVEIKPGRENRARMAIAEQCIAKFVENIDRVEKEAQKHGDSNDEQRKEHDGADGGANGAR